MPAIRAEALQLGSVEVFTLRSHEIDDHWFWIGRLLKRVENPDWTLAHVKADLRSAKAQAWCLGDGAPAGVVITRIENYHDLRYGVLWIAAGDGVEHARLILGPIERWFKEKGCSRCNIEGRKGWERVLPDYAVRAVVLSKEL